MTLSLGLIEGFIGLSREFLPKKMAFEFIATKDIEFAMHAMHRPSKCLGYKTSSEDFMNQPTLLQFCVVSAV